MKDTICDIPTLLKISTITLTCNIKSILGTDTENILNIVNMMNNIKLSDGCVIQLKSGNMIKEIMGYSKLTRKKKIIAKKKEKNGFYNQISLKINIDYDELTKVINDINDVRNRCKIVSVKLFSNGAIQITGCKKSEHIKRTLNKVVELLNSEYDVKIINLQDPRYKLTLSDIENINTQMINSDFKLNDIFVKSNTENKINCNECYNILKLTPEYIDEKILITDCLYLPQIHAAVRLGLEYKKNYAKIFIFESGRINISAKNNYMTFIAFNFIIKFLFDNYDKIKI